MTESVHLKAALAYAGELGWAVLPLHHVDAQGPCSCSQGAHCTSPGKHPRTRHGLQEATTDAATLRHWWGQWPAANLGVATGTISGFDALDVDPRHGGQHSLEALEDTQARLPDTVEQHTGGGGRHLLFAHQEGIRNQTHLAPGLDVRGDGGYIVVAPSLHPSGLAYVWEDASRPGTVALASWPAWLLALLLPLRGSQTPLNGQTPLVGEGKSLKASATPS